MDSVANPLTSKFGRFEIYCQQLSDWYDMVNGYSDGGEECSCVASCPQRVLEFGDLDELAAKHAGELIGIPAALAGYVAEGPEQIIRMKECMADPDFDEIII